jgi:hypothetical protein
MKKVKDFNASKETSRSDSYFTIIYQSKRFRVNMERVITNKEIRSILQSSVIALVGENLDGAEVRH